MLFRPTIGTWCKGTEKSWSGEKVTIAMAFQLPANNFIFFSEDSSIKTYPKNSLHLSATSPLAILYARDDFKRE